MNQDSLKDVWQQLRSKIQEQWSDLTEEDLDTIAGDKDKLLDKIQELYSLTKKEVQADWNKFYKESSKALNEIQEETSTAFENIEETLTGFVKKSPYKAVGIAAVVGLLVGLRF
jgi:ElaB/YqjD/DUF883 family membrane-anchored ribosome-binding protein